MASQILEKLRDEGGFTLNLNTTGDWVTEGFAVSVNPELTRVIDGPVDALAVLTYVRDHWTDLQTKGKVFGGWVDTETGLTYLDVVTIVDSKEEALDLAVQHGELAVYDIAGGQEIRTGVVKA